MGDNPIRIKGLYEKLGTTPEQMEELRRMLVEAAVLRMQWYAVVVNKGGNLHGVDRRATKKRRAANKVAHKQRMVNQRDRS